MKLPLLRWPGLAPATTGSTDAAPEPAKPSLPVAWLLLHALFCATSMAVGFRFSRLIVYLLFLPTPFTAPASHLASLVSPPVMLNTTATFTTTTTVTHAHVHHGPVFVGRHPIRVRPWPHPDPNELLKAHRILAAVQDAQRTSWRRASSSSPLRPVIAVTPTATSALQVPSLTSLAHTLRLVDGQLTWIVVEPGHRTDAVAAVLSRSKLDFLHVTAGPTDSTTARLRMHALREIRKRQMDGIVVFADENSILRTELFDEAQKVNTVGAVPVGILSEDDGASESFLQAPACDGEGKLVVGYRVSEDTVLPANRSDMLLSSGLEWAGLVVNARALWDGAKADRPDWVRDLDAVVDDVASPIALVTDAGRVEPLGRCAQTTALAWSLRSDTIHDIKFPHEWKISPPVLSAGVRQQTVDEPETSLKRATLANTEDQH